jgi:hypothetical protein
MNQKCTDFVGVFATIDPDAYTASTYTSDYVDASVASHFLALIKVGTMASTSTVDAKLVQATDSSGTGKKDISGKAITQLTEAGTDSDKQAIITLLPTDLDTDNSFTHFAIEMTVGTAASDADATILGIMTTDQPPTDLASVDEIV